MRLSVLSRISSRTAIWRCATRPDRPIIQRIPLEGPKESPMRGFQHFPAEEQGPERGCGRKFCRSLQPGAPVLRRQTPPEQRHIISASPSNSARWKRQSFVRGWSRIFAVIDETPLAATVAQKLGLQSHAQPADAAMPTRQDLEPSPTALSIVRRRPKRFGRKLGLLITDGVDAKLLKG